MSDTDAAIGSQRTSSSSQPRFEYLPIGLFGSVMGLVGLAGAWRLAHVIYGAPDWPANLLGYASLVDFLVLAAAYSAKIVTARSAVVAEFNHPVAGSLFGTFLISVLLLPLILAPMNLTFARIVWACGAVLMILFAWLMVTRWMSERQQAAHAVPTWIVPVVGLIDIPLAVPALQLTEVRGVTLFATAVGLFFAIPLFTMIFSRLLFEARLPDTLRPALLILVAPFSVGYSAYVITTGQSDIFAGALYMVMLFVIAVLVGQLRYLPACCPFRVSWWAVSFPLAASSTAALRFAQTNPHWATDLIAILILAFSTLVVAALAVRTLVGMAKGELRTLSS